MVVQDPQRMNSNDFVYPITLTSATTNSNSALTQEINP